METRNRYDGILPPKAITTIRRQAEKLAGHPAFRWAEPEDFEQELAVHALERIGRHDPSRAGLPTFLTRITRNHAATLVARETAAIRWSGTASVSLNDPVVDEDVGNVDMVEIIPESQDLWADGGRSWEAMTETRLDAERLLSLLPASLRGFAIRFSTGSITDISRESGTPRATLYDALARIRGHIRKKMGPGSDVFEPMPVCKR